MKWIQCKYMPPMFLITFLDLFVGKSRFLVYFATLMHTLLISEIGKFENKSCGKNTHSLNWKLIKETESMTQE